MISTEYVQAGEKGPQIIMHNETHGTRRGLKGMLKRALASQNSGDEGAGGNSHAATQTSPSSISSSSGTVPYQSLLKAHPQFHDLLDVSNWPTLPPPTNPVHTSIEPNNLWQRPEILVTRPCIDSHDSALPPPYSRHHDGSRD